MRIELVDLFWWLRKRWPAPRCSWMPARSAWHPGTPPPPSHPLPYLPGTLWLQSATFSLAASLTITV